MPPDQKLAIPPDRQNIGATEPVTQGQWKLLWGIIIAVLVVMVALLLTLFYDHLANKQATYQELVKTVIEQNGEIKRLNDKIDLMNQKLDEQRSRQVTIPQPVK